jgi:hypothetical protein
MYKIFKILKVGLVFTMVALFTCTGCAVKKNPWAKKHSTASHVNTSQLGRNKYYFSTNYQKKLTKSVKK